MSSLLVKVEKINKVEKHPNADKLSIVSMRRETLQQITNERLNYTDAGLTKLEFYNLMQKFYSKKNYWKKYNTYCLILYFKKVKI